jgi:CO dehydrogenase/acetyl-CoA synthase epsilon subunit
MIASSAGLSPEPADEAAEAAIAPELGELFAVSEVSAAAMVGKAMVAQPDNRAMRAKERFMKGLSKYVLPAIATYSQLQRFLDIEIDNHQSVAFVSLTAYLDAGSPAGEQQR